MYLPPLKQCFAFLFFTTIIFLLSLELLLCSMLIYLADFVDHYLCSPLTKPFMDAHLDIVVESVIQSASPRVCNICFVFDMVPQ